VPAYFSSKIDRFDDPARIVGLLVEGNFKEAFDRVEKPAHDAWNEEVEFLYRSFPELISKNCNAAKWGILLEFPVPRRMKRIDAVLLSHDVVFVIEFKTTRADSSAYWQVWDYALDLVDFHEPSHHLVVIPVVVAKETASWQSPIESDGRVIRPRFSTYENFAENLELWFREFHNPEREPIDIHDWNHGQYRPVPTIVEAALAIFAGMEVREIAHSHAGAVNLTATVDSIIDAIRSAHVGKQKLICFVTGVPGAGKTLAGLRAVHDPRIKDLTGSDPHFMSGNGPLVRVLREALTRDKISQRGGSRHDLQHRVDVLIQNVHIMARENWDDELKRPPQDRIIVFDEAQRAWNAKQNLRKFKRNVSEPEMLLSVMDRHPDWAVIVALVGGGQEINDGEAGLREWGRAIETKFRHWGVLASPEAVNGGAAVAGSTLFDETAPSILLRITPEFHLAVSTRSYKAQRSAEWTNLLLLGDLARAKEVALSSDEPIAWVTRDIGRTRAHLLRLSEGTSRCGLLASSAATRLRAFGIETATSFHRSYPYEYWFLNGREDVRSSFQLEVVATEFEVQGLELDHVGLCWGPDLVFKGGKWIPRRLTATIWNPNRPVKMKWTAEKNDAADFRRNAYRVLLTRARQGTLIWVPKGRDEDDTNAPSDYNGVFDALVAAGAVELP
jgi:hypothetical protein